MIFITLFVGLNKNFKQINKEWRQRRNVNSCILMEWKDFIVAFEILPASLRINLTSDRLTGGEKEKI